MASFEATIALNISRAAFLARANDEAKSEGAAQLGLASLQAKLDMLEAYWEKFEGTHEKLVSSSGKVDKVMDLPYFKSNTFDTAIAHYAEARSQLAQLIEKKGVSSQSRRSMSVGTAQSSSSKRYLPEISLPKFSGVYAQWRSFRDLFSSLVGSNLDLSNVEKMHYLRTSLSGEAAQIIANLTISDDSFATAWDLLTGRYENTRLLISAHLEQLLNPPSMTAHSAKELNALLTTVSEALNALEALGSPTHHWDQVVIHTVSQRLSSKLREAWEVRVGSSTDYPAFADLKEFLVGRARAMESIEINTQSRAPPSKVNSSTHSSSSGRNSQSRSQGSARVNNVSAQPSPAQRPAQAAPRTNKVTYPCSMCEADHYLTSCAAFKRLTLEGRREVVTRRYLCYNCLGRHSVRDCRSRTKCQICGLSHHSLLHPPSSGPQQPSRPAQPVQQQQQNRPAQPVAPATADIEKVSPSE